MTPSNRSIQKMEKQGYLVWNVERRINKRLTRDLFGFLDLVAIRRDITIGIQVTSASNVSARVKKITDHENVGRVREAGWRIEVHGWRKKKDGWHCRVVDLS